MLRLLRYRNACVCCRTNLPAVRMSRRPLLLAVNQATGGMALLLLLVENRDDIWLIYLVQRRQFWVQVPCLHHYGIMFYIEDFLIQEK